jgi:hypothetical protein
MSGDSEIMLSTELRLFPDHRGVAGVYQRHKFVEEKTDALERLSGLLHEIVSS